MRFRLCWLSDKHTNITIKPPASPGDPVSDGHAIRTGLIGKTLHSWAACFGDIIAIRRAPGTPPPEAGEPPSSSPPEGPRPPYPCLP
jgi:hypothetical protein